MAVRHVVLSGSECWFRSAPVFYSGCLFDFFGRFCRVSETIRSFLGVVSRPGLLFLLCRGRVLSSAWSMGLLRFKYGSVFVDVMDGSCICQGVYVRSSRCLGSLCPSLVGS